MPAWSEYQEEVAQFFRDLGLEAETNSPLQGIRTSHNIDVLVRTKHVGIDLLWIVECKHWKYRVTKEKVLALRSIVEDTGADRGFLMAERGYQPGALEAARLTNVMLSSLADLREVLAYELGMARLRSLQQRVDLCRERYWSMSKSDRIEHGLRPDSGAFGYSGQQVIIAVASTLHAAFLDGFPVIYDVLQRSLAAFTFDRRMEQSANSKTASTPAELADILDAELAELEHRLDAATRTGGPEGE